MTRKKKKTDTDAKKEEAKKEKTMTGIDGKKAEAKKEEIKEEKPVKEKNIKKATVEDKTSPQVKQYFNLYLENITTGKVNDAIRALAGLFLQLISKSNPYDLDYTLKQFINNKNKLLDITVGLQGIQTLKPNIRSKVETIFILIYNLALKTDNKLDFNRIKTIIKNDKVVNWFSSKMKNNKLKKK